jgi:hypothetical protein
LSGNGERQDEPGDLSALREALEGIDQRLLRLLGTYPAAG